MPTYEYNCQKCGQAFEVFQSMSETPLKTCPKDKCPRARWGRGKVKRAIGGGGGLLFKGSGFYITDYRSEGYRQAAKNESSAASGSAGGESKSAPAKPAKPAPAGGAPGPGSKPA